MSFISAFSTVLPVTGLGYKHLNQELSKDFFAISHEDHDLTRFTKQIGNGLAQVVKMISVVALPIFLAADLVKYIARKFDVFLMKVHHEDFHLLYESKIYGEYLTQLKVFVNQQLPLLAIMNPLNNKIDEFYQLVNTCQAETEDERRAFHQDMLGRLRELVSLKEEYPGEHASVRFIETVCEWIYLGTNFLQEMNDFTDEQLSEASKEELLTLPASEIPELIRKLHGDLDYSPKFMGIDESGKRLYDPHLLGDVPTMLYPYQHPQNGKITKMIRTPAVTKDVAFNAKGKAVPEIVEEFRGFLDHYRKSGKVHLYINLMERANGSSEDHRSTAIEQLETEYPDTLRVITLNKDGSFYKQLNDHDDIDFTTFKNQFKTAMFDATKCYYHWTPAFNNWKQVCEAIINKVHTDHFEGKETLDKAERLDLIELAYTEIIDAAIGILKPDSCNISCKSCIDRGAAAFDLHYAKHSRSSNPDLSAIQRKNMAAIALAPALLAQTRLMQAPRMERMHTAAKRILSKIEE